jgi:hypothetical protein
VRERRALLHPRAGSSREAARMEAFELRELFRERIL